MIYFTALSTARNLPSFFFAFEISSNFTITLQCKYVKDVIFSRPRTAFCMYGKAHVPSSRRARNAIVRKFDSRENLGNKTTTAEDVDQDSIAASYSDEELSAILRKIMYRA